MVTVDFGGGGRFGMTKFLTVTAVQEILNVDSRDTVYGLIKSGKLRAYKTGKGGKTSKWMIYADSLNTYIEKNTKRALQSTGV